MPLFITQGRFTREYIKGGLAKPEDRHAAISRLCEQAGGKLVSLYFTLGQYDFMVISEMWAHPREVGSPSAVAGRTPSSSNSAAGVGATERADALLAAGWRALCPLGAHRVRRRDHGSRRIPICAQFAGEQ